MQESVFTRMRQGLDSFTPSEKKIAKFILNNASEASNLSVTELSKKCNTSEASIIRFCKRLGLNGYHDLKLAISLNLIEEQPKDRVLHEVINADDSMETILHKLSSASIQAIEETNSVLDTDQLSLAVQKINSADSIHFYGVGASSLVALDAQYKFARINIPAFMYVDHHIQLTTAVHLTNKDVAIGISYSGRTMEVIDLLRIAKEKGATTIAITKYGSSPIEEVSDIVLYTASVENNFRSGAMASRIAQLLVIDSLFIGVACKRYDEVIEYLRITREALAVKKY